MNVEIERKFIIDFNKFLECWLPNMFQIWKIEQGYLSNIDESIEQRITIREVILDTEAEAGKLVSKLGIKTNNTLVRTEFEYDIPNEDAEELMKLTKAKIVKYRFLTNFFKCKDKYMQWEIDFFPSKLNNLAIAEIELPTKDFKIELPNWIIKEVTNDKTYYNSNLAFCNTHSK